MRKKVVKRLKKKFSLRHPPCPPSKEGGDYLRFSKEGGDYLKCSKEGGDYLRFSKEEELIKYFPLGEGGKGDCFPLGEAPPSGDLKRGIKGGLFPLGEIPPSGDLKREIKGGLFSLGEGGLRGIDFIFPLGEASPSGDLKNLTATD